ncbi:MAG: radical SAM protein [Firmicutes bacterium]|nr:radical SAM protein [Bacillota bacterium]
MISSGLKALKERFSAHRKKMLRTYYKNAVKPEKGHKYKIKAAAIELTNKCNLRCLQCNYKGGSGENYERNTGLMPVDFFKKALDQLIELGCESILCNADGEATLHPNFLDCLEYASSKKLQIHFNTNGNLWNKNFIEGFLSFYKGSVIFSLDGFKESHARIRVGSNYDRVVNNLELLLKMKGRDGFTNPAVGVAFCNYDQEPEEIEKFVEYWLPKVDVVSLCQVYDSDTKVISRKLNEIDPAKMQRVICRIPWENVEIGWNGDVIPCSSYIVTPEGIIGNLHQHSLKEIWEGDKLRAFRVKHRNYKLDGTKCLFCERWKAWYSMPDKYRGETRIILNGVFKLYYNKHGRRIMLGEEL